LQEWESLLYTVGGKLEISKCNLVQFRWQMDLWGTLRLVTVPCTNPTLINDHELNTPIQIKEISTSAPYKLLGIQMAFDGNNKAQHEAMQKKCTKLAHAFASCAQNPLDTLQGYRSIFLPGVRYGMSATTLSMAQLHNTQKLVTSIILPKLGYNRHMPRQIVFAPTHFGGIGLNDLYVEQGLAQLTFLLKHLRLRTVVTDTIITMIESYIIAAGVVKSPFEDTKLDVYIQAPWIQSLQSFLQLVNVTLTIPNIICPALIRQHDTPIMTLAAQYSTNQQYLQAVNNCRLWLQVTTLAEITDANGHNLLPPALLGKHDTHGQPTLWAISTSTHNWPHQPKPPNKAWKI
jgi:hypothetical protein